MIRIFSILLVLSVCTTSCGVFSTRDAEDPAGGGGAGFQQPDRPEVVITNIIASVSALSVNNYTRNFSNQDFNFTPSTRAVETNPDIWISWDIESETTYFSNLQASAQNQTGHSLEFTNEQRVTLPDGGERFTASYEINIFHNRLSDGIPTEASGSVIFDLIQDDNGLWSIQSWTDNSGTQQFSWSELKASFFN
ncbi:MAG: hypothetical protein LAT67_09245 [Balneolales bacterium]|nr:hypothetical protein [Balneolales bacterium]